MLRRHPLLSILGLLFLALLIGGVIFIATFDLNRYRTQLEAELSELLQQPVRIGEAHLALLHGPSLDFKNLRIGSNDGENNVLQAEHLYLQFEFGSLLHGRITFSRISLDAPKLTVVLNSTEKTASASLPQAHWPGQKGLLGTALVHSLTLGDGTFRLVDRRNPERQFSVTLENLQGHFSDISLKTPLHLQISGILQQEEKPAVFSLTGMVAPPVNLNDWHALGLNLELTIQNFIPQLIIQRYFNKVETNTSGQLSASVKIQGSPGEGVKLDGHLSGEEFSFGFPTYHRSLFPLHNMDFTGTWTAVEDHQRFENLSLKIDDLAIEGNLVLATKDNSEWLEGTLSSPGISVVRALGFLPDREPTSSANILMEHFTGGTISLRTVRFDGPVSAFRHFDRDFPLREAKISLQKGIIRIRPDVVLEEVDASVALAGERLTLERGNARLADSSLRFSGYVDRVFQPDRELQLVTEGTLPAKTLPAFLQVKKPENLTLEGAVPLKVVLNGTLDDLQANLSSDLDDLSFQLGNEVSKAAGQKGTLSLSGEITPQLFMLREGRLMLPFIDLAVSGSLARKADRKFNVVFDVPHLDLAEARAQVPVFEKLDARGGLSLHYQLSGDNGRIRNRQGEIQLRDFGIHVVRTIADINHANGKIRLSGDRAELANLLLKMGFSPLMVRGTIKDFADPKFDLRIQGKAVQGDDLHFFSTDAVLRDLEAHLLIDHSHINFEKVTVKLDGGTDATVKGTISNFKAPQVSLDIQSEHANIDEIIQLWQKPRPPAEQQAPPGKTLVHINARVNNGTLGGMQFQNAEGEISSQQGILTIHPLHFHVGKGYYAGEVAVDHSSGSPPLLKISGHLENFDAPAIYKDLLKRKSLVTGSLRGDFYLEGRAGKDFLPTSLGGFNVEVEKGVLRKFQFLSKVFSLLNVSQILTFQLPDMSLEGMPFNTMKATLSLQRGTLSTEDLLVDSNAMNLSLVGSMNLEKQTLDLTLGVKPLQTVDKIITNIPIAGWILTGKEKALITVYFRIRGKAEDPNVEPIPGTMISDKVLGIFKRVLQLPGKMITDVGEILGVGESEKNKK
jgi:uncharacterized protein involved in outer membrane biogenesis